MYIASNLHSLSPLVHHHWKPKICKRREQNLCGNLYRNRIEPLDFVAHTLSLVLCSCASPCELDGIDEEDDDDGRSTASKKEDARTDVKALFNPSLHHEVLC
jgi:hypothetical protein